MAIFRVRTIIAKLIDAMVNDNAFLVCLYSSLVATTASDKIRNMKIGNMINSMRILNVIVLNNNSTITMNLKLFFTISTK